MKNIVLAFCLIIMVIGCKNDTKASLPEINEVISDEKDKIQDTIVEVVKEPIKTAKQIKAELKARGFQVESYYDEDLQDTVIMQQYFMAFLKKGPIRTQNEEEAELIQKGHRAHLGKMYDLGYADISGPFGDEGEIKGITIYNVPTLKMADSLANSDPAVKAGRLEIEIHPWWAAKGFPLR
ncbi:YciI family protein [Seonamhaeicola marinus]|uniref:YCII-related domain-containing protein n=1 Tax=Seonamhaeicola marinus TaxID=1912246 RepID=A0A5D0HTJ9_9FLAO|nr:hypothetical protein [Seonamhaeicola marinus]TYA74321.1 hypothetical protein FUA24_13415 [Seonamhaeicola marinus]